MSSPREQLLVVIPFAPDHLSRFEAAYDVIYAPDPQRRAAAIAGEARLARAVLTHGVAGFTAAEMDAMSKLELIACYGVGYDHIDVAAALERGVIVTHGPGTNASSVADHALALTLSAIRRIAESDRAVRAGQWHEARRATPELTGMRVGIVGLGAVGRAVARRCALGFDAPVGYHSRRPAPDVAYTYHDTVRGLAEASDVLIIAAPGGPATRHMVDANILDALGKDGYLVNIARGSLVDTQALIAALHAGRIAGAALDVVEGEPTVPAGLLEAPNLVITPHSAARSPRAEDNMTALALQNIAAHLSGAAVLTPVPEWAARLGR